MRGLVAKIAMLLGVLTLAVSSAVADPPSGRVTSVRFGGEGAATRVVIETDAALQYHVFLLATGSNRVVIDLPRVRWSINGLTTESGSGAGMGVVAGYRYAHNTATTSRHERVASRSHAVAVEPSTFSMARYTRSPSMPTSWTVTTLG